MRTFEKALCLLFITAVLIIMPSCAQKEVVQDTSPVTMLIASGNGESYYTALAEMIEEDLGIDVEFVYQISNNTTDMQKLYFENNDLPADIIFTASKTDDSILKDSCVDLLSNSTVTNLFTPTVIAECTTEEGEIYQLPVSSRLIGITYNETLLNEMGWDVPETFEDMLDLKAKCDEAGIKFAVSDGIATGHGFNWLFHLMGAQWLSTPDGTEWLEGYQSGTRTVDEFMQECEYFKKWTEAGLWGVFHNQDWNGSQEFSKTRALFWFGLVNTVTGYEGPMYDDEGNETGVTLNDTYKTIPWISEDGTNNCYTYYDNCWVYVNKELEAADKAQKLENCFKIIEYMASDKATALVSDIAKDTYVSVNNYQIGDDRIYSAYNDNIRNGFIQPWYYNYFDGDSINFTGSAVNAYINGTGSYEDIFTALDKYNQLMLSNEYEALAEFPDGLDYENTAKLVGISALTALDMTLQENGYSERAEVALVPYTPGANMLQPWKSTSVSNSIVYPGGLDISKANTIFAPGTTRPTGVYMTGAEIKSIIEKQFDPSDRFIDSTTGLSTFDSEKYGPYPYVCIVKDGAELEDDRTYLVAICEKYLTLADYTAFSDNGKVITDLENIHTLDEGLRSFASSHPQITASDLVW